MPDTKISALTAASAAVGTQELAVNESGTSKKVTVAQLLAAVGRAGVPGLDGSDGTDGEPGPPGETGPQGETGATGDTGAAGADGVDGATGPPGLDGSDGADGEPGPIGLKGAAGADGGGGALTSSMAQLSANVEITSANTFFDGPSLSLAAGTWLLIASVLAQTAGNAGALHTHKLLAGATALASTETSAFAAGILTATVVLGSTTTVKVSVATTIKDSSNILAAAPDNGAGDNASTLVALKIA